MYLKIEINNKEKYQEQLNSFACNRGLHKKRIITMRGDDNDEKEVYNSWNNSELSLFEIKIYVSDSSILNFL